MKKNEKIISLIIKNNNSDYFKFNNYNTSKNREKKKISLNKMKYNISTGPNIISDSLNYTQERFLNTNLKLNKINSIYDKSNLINQNKKSIQNRIVLNKNSFNESKSNNKIYNNNIKENISYINIDNKKHNDIIYDDDDTDRSSMETIKKILISTENKKKVKKNKNNNNFIRSTQISGLPNLKDMLNNFNISIGNKNGNLTPLKEINTTNEIGHNYFKKINYINKNRSTNENIFKKINNEFKQNKRSEGMNSMKLLKTSINNDRINNSGNEKEKYNNMINNYKYLVKKLYNNMDNENKNKNSVENYNNKEFSKKNYFSRNNNIEINNDLENLNNNMNISENLTKKDNNIIKDKTSNENISNNSINNNVIYLKAKIKILTEEIRHKNAVIREYSILAGNSKIKFEQLIDHNNKIIEKIKRESKKQIMIFKNKILSLEKEKQNILNKYTENKKYSEFLENLLFENGNLNELEKNSNNTNLDKSNQIKKLEYIIKKLMNDIANMKADIKNKNEDNDKLRNIIFRFKKSINSASYKTMNNSGKNILNNIKTNNNANTIELSKYEKLLKKMGEDNMKNKGKISKNLSQKSNMIFNRVIDFNSNGKK